MCSYLAGFCCRFVFLGSSSDRISCDLFLVNNFFHFLENQFRSMRSYCLVRSCSLEQRIVLYHRCFRIASSFFKFLKTLNSVSRIHLAKRRKRDLNPRAGINRPTPLAGAPLQPLEYFSRFWIIPVNRTLFDSQGKLFLPSAEFIILDLNFIVNEKNKISLS